MALSVALAFASGCKESPPPPAPDPAGQAAASAPADKPAAPEALTERAPPASPVVPADPAATASPPPAAPATARGELDKQAGGPNIAAPALPPPSKAVPASSATAAAPPAEVATATAAQKPEPPPVEVTSPKVAEAAFNLWMQSSGRYKAGQQGHVEVVLVPKGDYHCNEQYPYKFKPVSSAGVTFPQAVVMADSMSKSAARSVMRVPFVPASPGEARVAGKFHFSVCTASQCLMDSREVAVTVKVD